MNREITLDPKERSAKWERRDVAYHEAGHAVAGYVMKLETVSASIIAEDGSLGHVRYGETSWIRDGMLFDEDDAHEAERHIFSALAGELAEQLVTGTPNPEGAAGDREKAELLSQRRWPNGDWPEELQRKEEQVRDFIQRPDIRLAVQAVAQALLEKQQLSSDEIERILEGILSRDALDEMYDLYAPPVEEVSPEARAARQELLRQWLLNNPSS